LNGEVLSAPPRQPKGKKDHHSTIRDMMVTSSNVLSLIPGGKYTMGIKRWAGCLLFLQEQIKVIIIIRIEAG
jgi:hypothetical protein